MKSRTTIIAIGLLVIALGVTGVVVGTNKKSETKPVASSRSSSMSMHGGHNGATLDMLKQQTGDAYDEMFIMMMSEHHAGAIAMANVVVNDAKHPELKALAQNIITAQTKELADMKSWAANWGYTYMQPSQSAIDDMTMGLKGKTGDALDKQFLADMIGHHQSALDMATLSSSRAMHDEIKTLSNNIEMTQTKEIAQMKGFQSTWGYASSDTSNESMSGMHHN